MIVMVVCDPDEGGDDWAGNVLARLLGVRGIDARLLEVAPEAFAADSTQRVMWDQMERPPLLLTRWSPMALQTWLDQSGLSVRIIEPEAATLPLDETVAITNAGDPEDACEQVRRRIKADRRANQTPLDQRLDQWMDDLDAFEA